MREDTGDAALCDTERQELLLLLLMALLVHVLRATARPCMKLPFKQTGALQVPMMKSAWPATQSGLCAPPCLAAVS